MEIQQMRKKVLRAPHFVSHVASNGHFTLSAAGGTRSVIFLLLTRISSISISVMVTMAAEVAFPSKNKALLFAVKNLQNTSAYQDQWIADIDLAAAIRHEYGLWDPQFDAIVACVGI